jgi:hypothetical protein
VEDKKRPRGRPSEPLIDDVKLMQLRREKMSRQKCADYFGVSLSSIKVAEKRIVKKLTNSPMVVDQDVKSGIDALTQLVLINKKMLHQLERSEKLINREELKSADCDKAYAEAKDGGFEAQAVLDKIWTNNLKSALAIQTNVVNISGEIRKQIELQMKIMETLFNIQMQQEFQAEVIEVLKTADEIVAQTLIEKLKERKALRGLVKI